MEAKFTLKKTVSLTLGLSFLVMAYTGIMLFLTPKGKIAHWTDWHLLGLTKTQYTDLHITSMFLFLAMGTWHIYYNWKPLVSYLKNSARRITPFKKEFLLALALNLFFVGATLGHLPPMQSIVNLNTAIKNYWERSEGAPPFGHAEEETLQNIVRQKGLNAETARKRLGDTGILFENGRETLQQIAERNDVSAQTIFDTLAPEPSAPATSAPMGLGRRSLGELADAGEFDLTAALATLKAQGCDATADTRMREAANALGTTPYALFETLKR